MEKEFIHLCETNNNLNRIKKLVGIGVNIHYNNEYGFHIACANGHLEVVKYLISLDDKPNIHADNELGFRMACSSGHLEVVKYLCSLCSNYYVKINNEGRIHWKIKIGLEERLKKLKIQINTCPICQETNKKIYELPCFETHKLCGVCIKDICKHKKNQSVLIVDKSYHLNNNFLYYALICKLFYFRYYIY